MSRSTSNAWYDAICAVLAASGGPLRVMEIWKRMEASGFQHKSEMPRSTLGARVAELVKMKKIEHVAFATYQLSTEVS